MQRRTQLTLSILVLARIMLGCSEPSNTNMTEVDNQFATAIPVTDMNKSLNMLVDSEKQYFSLSTIIPLIVENKSSQSISFDPITHIKLLANSGGEWVEVKNDVTYSGIMILSSRGTPLLDFQYTRVKPNFEGIDLDNGNELILLRIVIIGEIMNDKIPTGNKVGAFVDISVKPSELEIQPTEGIIYSTAQQGIMTKGKIEGAITSADAPDKPFSSVKVDLKYNPFFAENNQTGTLATTTTNAQGIYSFDDVDPGVYSLQVTIFMEQGGSCSFFDAANFIKIEPGVTATVNLSFTCTP